MNKYLLNTGVQDFIIKNINTDIVSLLLKKPTFPNITSKELAQQIEGKKKCQKKLPTWFKTSGIYYPKKVNIEQTSSEISALYKSEIVHGKSLIDLTGGLGIDSYYFSKKIARIFHCEIEQKLHQIASYNYDILNSKNIQTVNENGLDFIKKSSMHFDWIYLDPSRRNKIKQKVFKLSDCTPSIAENLELLFSKSENILIKTSPLLDISLGIKEMKYIKEIHVVAINNDVKELLWVLKKGILEKIEVKTINFSKSDKQEFNFQLSEEKQIISEFSTPLKYLYEPNAALLKAGAFKILGQKFQLKKLHQHTHLYTSEKLVDFPGRRFKIIKLVKYKNISDIDIKKANISTRNFPVSVATLRKKFKIKDGGNSFLFFFKNCDNVFQVASCSKI